MSAVNVISYLLRNNAPLNAQVPAASIRPHTQKQGAALPYIGMKQISSVENLDVGMTGTRMKTTRVQATLYTATAPARTTIMALILAACPNQSGTVNGVSVDSILPGGEGPDFDDPDTSIFERSCDFIVKWS